MQTCEGDQSVLNDVGTEASTSYDDAGQSSVYGDDDGEYGSHNDLSEVLAYC